MVPLKIIQDGKDGRLYIAEGKREIPFSVKRVYFIDCLRKDSIRGLHAHKKLNQAIFCLRGQFRLTLYDGKKQIEAWLKKPEVGMLLPPLCWHSMDKFSKDCLICVFASDYFKEKDYIREFTEFKRLVK